MLFRVKRNGEDQLEKRRSKLFAEALAGKSKSGYKGWLIVVRSFGRGRRGKGADSPASGGWFGGSTITLIRAEKNPNPSGRDRRIRGAREVCLRALLGYRPWLERGEPPIWRSRTMEGRLRDGRLSAEILMG